MYPSHMCQGWVPGFPDHLATCLPRLDQHSKHAKVRHLTKLSQSWLALNLSFHTEPSFIIPLRWEMGRKIQRRHGRWSWLSVKDLIYIFYIDFIIFNQLNVETSQCSFVFIAYIRYVFHSLLDMFHWIILISPLPMLNHMLYHFMGWSCLGWF